MLHARRRAYYDACERYLQSPSPALARQLHTYAADVRDGFAKAGDESNATLWAHNVAYWLDVLHRAGFFPASPCARATTSVGAAELELDTR